MVAFPNAPLSYIEIQELTTYFRSKGHLDKAIMIYNRNGIDAVLDYRERFRRSDERMAKIRETVPDTNDSDTVAFCMRCFGNSAVDVDKKTNFCHNCGSEGTYIAIKKDEAEYLRNNIESAIRNAFIKGGIIK